VSFISLGLVNVRRNLGRSVLAIAAMAVAALVVTSLLSLAPSAHQAAQSTERFVLGGDVIVTGYHLLSRAADLSPADGEQASWRMRRYSYDLAGLWPEIVPWAWQYGVILPDGAGADGLMALGSQAERVTDLMALLSEHPRVAGVQPSTVLPVLERGPGPDGGWVRSWLMGRDPVADHSWWPEYLAGSATGRYLEPADQGGHVAVVDSSRQARGFAEAHSGSVIELFVPRATISARGEVIFDYDQLYEFAFEVVGNIDSVTGYEVTPGEPLPVRWSTGTVFVPSATIEALAREIGLPGAPVTGLGVRTTDLVDLPRLTGELQLLTAERSAYAVYSVRELVRAVEGTGAIQPLVALQEPIPGAQIAANLVPRMVPLNLNVVFSTLALTIAALIVAANLLLLLSERRREVSILRALGARTSDVALMVLAEAVFLSLAGCVLGFWPIRLLSTVTLISNRLSLGHIARLTMLDFAVVCGAATLLALLFGLLPAMASTRMTPTEALRND